MSAIERLKALVLKRPAPGADPRRLSAPLQGGRRAGESENPYLAARRTWNAHVDAIVAARQTWQLVGVLSLLIALAGVGGMIHIGSQSRFIPYVIEVDKLGQARAAGPLTAAAKADPRVIHASVAEFITDARLVTPDVALQRQAVFRVYAKLAASDPATAKMNEWLNATPESSPFKRAATVMVGIDIQSVLPQSPDTWQVDWLETTRDRQGLRQGVPVTMRALVTVYSAQPTPATTEAELRLNPLSIYVRDFAWSRRL